MNSFGKIIFRVCVKLLIVVVYLIAGLNTKGSEKSNNQIDISGKWQFALDPNDIGIEKEWYTKDALENQIFLPGCLQELGFGNIPDSKTQWWGFGSIEEVFEESPWLKEYKGDSNFKIQNWLLPSRHYIGAAWYAREIMIPENWEGNHITIFLERCHWETKLWIDGIFMGSDLSLGTPHIYSLDKIKPGKHRIVLRIDNSPIVDLGRQSHSVSEQTAGTWNGIVGKIEIRKQPPVWIENIQLFPDIHRKIVNANVTIGNLNPNLTCKWEIRADAVGFNNDNNHDPDSMIISGSHPAGSRAEIRFEYPLGEGMQLWDEFDPNLYKMEVIMHSAQNESTYADTMHVNFGMRDIKTVGTQFSINGIKTFLRGNTDCAVMPKTGYAPMDVNSWQKVWKTYKKFGLNMARFHSWCPPEAAFIAADEAGIYLAPEAGEWVAVKKQEQFDFLREESSKILNTYGNYASFIQFGLGNEAGGNIDYFYDIVEEWKTKDPRHLYTIKANSASNPENVDFEVVRGVGKNRSIKMRYQGGWPPTPQGSEFISRPPQTEIDWSEGVAKRNIPLIQHETAQICAYPAVLNEIPKYTGYLKPTYLEIAKDQLEERGMLKQLPSFVEASGKWQMELTREEFEAAYRTPGLAGFHWLSLADFTGQNTAPVGFTDAFYDPKSYVDPALVCRWNAPTVLLARMKKRVFAPNDRFSASIEVSHYGKEILNLNDLKAMLQLEDGTIIKTWVLPQKSFKQGSAQKIGNIDFSLIKLQNPVKLILKLESSETGLTNDWDFWVFPDEKTISFPDDIVVAELWNDSIEKLLTTGKIVLLLPEKGTLKGQLPVCFTNHYWTSFGENEGQSSASGVLINTKHPLFNNFPTESHANWHWWELLTQCQPMILDSYDSTNPWPKDFYPLIQPIDSWKINRKLALIAEAKMGRGKLLICSMDLENNLSNRPVANYFRKCLIKYMKSDAFNPQTEITSLMIDELFSKGDERKENNVKINLPSDG